MIQCFFCKRYLSDNFRSDQPNTWWRHVNIAAPKAKPVLVPVCVGCYEARQ